MFSHYFPTTIVLIKNRFNEFINSVFSPIQSNFFTVFIINTDYFISKTTRNMILIFFVYELIEPHSISQSTFLKIHSKSAYILKGASICLK